ncbi:inositol polyphosphate 1-phosphatase isoform X2 [Nilaparvata lugens]|uniref:inositol polyphosphate 1-phosphatase isoform X2 n=1 Tax=Nilaparvata lugens TaxID=108931 RepID=UPI00193D559E|nr:inositol polyphosphate 1-phosphatase isoform X2 [Nilaparvata lugens]
MDLLKSMLLVSEKAARIARSIRHDNHLLSLLVEEKTGCKKNPRFNKDFKTITDVLVQEVVKFDLSQKFPALTGHIYGEENNEIGLKTGEKVYLKIDTSKENTFNLLETLCDSIAAQLLADIVHKEVLLEELPGNVFLPELSVDLPLEEMAIWIDPIDSTGEYINPRTEKDGDVFTAGLHCVTVLIGAFSRESGVPVIGVINQPFHTAPDSTEWIGDVIWGLNFGETSICSLQERTASKVVIISASESDDIKKRLLDSGFRLIEAAGAGYKLLSVIQGQVNAYVISKSTTFFWDTCGCDAILRSLGGGIVSYQKALSGNLNNFLSYSNISDPCNHGGLIAYTNPKILDEIVDALKK